MTSLGKWLWRLKTIKGGLWFKVLCCKSESVSKEVCYSTCFASLWWKDIRGAYFGGGAEGKIGF